MNDETDRLALTIGPTQLPFELIASGSECAMQPVIRIFPEVDILDMAYDSQDTLWMTGSLNKATADKDIFLARLSSTGELMSAQSFGGTADDIAYSLAFDSTGSVWLAGETSSFDVTNSSDALIAQFSSSGSLMKALCWGGEFNDYADALIIGEGDSVIERYFVCKNQLQYLEKPLKF